MNFKLKYICSFLSIIFILIFSTDTPSTGETLELRTPAGGISEEIDSPREFTTEEINRLLAVVEGEAVTLRDYREQFGDTVLTRENLAEIIDKKLIEVAMDKIIDPRMEERLRENAREHVRMIKAREGEENFRRFLLERQLTEAEFIEEMISQEKSVLLLRQLFPGAEQAMAGATSLTRGRLMIFQSKDTARKVHENLKDSPTFRTWKQQFERYSLKPGFLGDHGDLGWFNWGTRSREIEYHFFSLSQYEISSPFTDGNNHFLAYKTNLRLSPPGKTPTPGMAKAYEELSRRYMEENYRDKLPDRLRQELTVIHPPSIVRKLES